MTHNLGGETATAMVVITARLCQGQGQGEMSEALISGTKFNVVLKCAMEINNTLLQRFKKIKVMQKAMGEQKKT